MTTGAGHGSALSADERAALRSDQLERTHAENTLAPLAYLARIETERAAGHGALADLLEAGVVGQRLRAARVLKPYVAHDLTADATLFHCGAAPGTRHLLIAFTGASMRLMMPVALFLQAMDARGWDVLVLRDRERSHFRSGMPGVAASFPARADWACALARPYRGAATIGCSMGGLVATRLALYHGGMRGVSVGGRPADDTMRLFQAVPPPAFDPICACLPDRPRDLLFVAPAANVPDLRAAERAAKTSGAQVLALRTSGSHNVLWDLEEAGLLPAFLRSVLDERATPRSMTRALGRARVVVRAIRFVKRVAGRIARLAVSARRRCAG